MSWFIQNILKPKIDGYIINNQELSDLNFDFGIGVDMGKVLVVRSSGSNISVKRQFKCKHISKPKSVPSFHAFAKPVSITPRT